MHQCVLIRPLFSDSQNLTAAIDYTGDTYNEIGDLFEQQVCEYKNEK